MTVRIYAACLASYNNGVLHGRWIDADSDVDAMQTELAAMLRASPYPNVTVPDHEAAARAAGWSDGPDAVSNIPNDEGYWMKEGVTEPAGNYRAYVDAREVCEGEGLEPVQVPSAEEWAMHDSEGLPSTFGEYCGLQAVADYVALCEEHSHIDSDDMAAIVADFGTVDAARGALDDNFCGIYPSFKDYAEEAADEMLSAHENLPEAVSRYFDYAAFARDLRHDMHPVDVPSGVAVFYA